MTQKDALLTAILCAIYLVLAIPAFSGLPNPDLMAAWAGAMAWMDGAGPAVYGSVTGAFDTLAPPALAEAFDELGYSDPQFSYIYPPLWLAVLGPVTETVPYTAFLQGATIANNLMMLGMVLLAWKASKSTLPAPAFLLIGLIALCGSQVGGLALFHNQVQIAVSLLIVLAAERTVGKAPRAAGIALALAAALKGYPVLLAVIWIARKDWHALRAFGLTGGALAALSIGTAGWDMHLAFIDQLGQVARTAIVSPVTFNITSLFAHLFIADDMAQISYGADNPARIMVAELGNTTKALLSLAMLVVVAATYAVGRQSSDAVLWVIAAGAISLLTSVSWSFHYLVQMAFLPLLIDRLGWARGGAIVAIITAMVSYPAVGVWRSLLDVYAPLQIGGTFAMIGAVVALGIALRTDGRVPSQPLAQASRA